MNRLAQKRLSPGILVFNIRGKVMYLNHDALTLLKVASPSGAILMNRFPSAIKKIYSQLKRGLQKATKNPIGPIIKASVLLRDNLILRGFGLHNHRQPSQQAQILFLIERIGRRDKIDFSKLSSRFGLSRREAEIVGQILQGLGNKTIAERLYISPYTVEDHIKNIMRKMGVQSRTAVIAKLLAD